MLFLFMIRRLNPRLRAIVGVSMMLVGLALVGLAATVAFWLLIHGIIAAAVGIAFCIAAYLGGETSVSPRTSPLRPATAACNGYSDEPRESVTCNTIRHGGCGPR